MGLRLCSKEALLPFIGMVISILAQVTSMEITKIALSQGMNRYVIIVYSDAIAALVLLPCCLIVHRSDRTPLTFSLVCSFFLLSLFGLGIQIFGYTGLQYSSATLGTAMLNLIPAFTFILAIIFRLEEVDCRSKSSIAKYLGTIISIGGAFVVIFYKGPSLFGSSTSHIHQQLLHSSRLLWIVGGFSFAAKALLDSSGLILEAFILRNFPAVLTIMCFVFSFDTILSGIFALVVVKDTSAWKLRLDMGLFAIFYAAIIGYAFRISLITWCLSKTGPLYVSMFKPLAILFAAVSDAIFLGDALSLGSLIGGIIVVTGFYVVLWGKATEEKSSQHNRVGSSEFSGERDPLLQNKTEEI